jgi:hypothetical protein
MPWSSVNFGALFLLATSATHTVMMSRKHPLRHQIDWQSPLKAHLSEINIEITNTLTITFMPIYSRFRSTVEHRVILDRITICYNDSNSDNVRDTCRLLLSERYTREISGLRIRPNARYEISATIPVPFMTASADRHPICFEAGPRRPGCPSYRLDFNPSQLSQAAIDQVKVLLDTTIDPTPEEFFSTGRITRIDAAVDLHGFTIDDLIVLTARKQKHGVYSNRYGIPETVYLGTLRSSRVVAYTKPIGQFGLLGTRLECRLKPNCTGQEVAGLPNPFATIRLLPTRPLDGLISRVPGQLLADSIRLRGLPRTLQLFELRSRNRITSALNRSISVLPNADALWAGWPDALVRVGLGEELGVHRLEPRQVA